LKISLQILIYDIIKSRILLFDISPRNREINLNNKFLKSPSEYRKEIKNKKIIENLFLPCSKEKGWGIKIVRDLSPARLKES
jgi:hypothetical protein